MARLIKRRKQTRRSARLDFAAIEVAGGLLPTDVIAQIAAGDAAEQSDQSYNVPKGLKLRDEIARFYQIALAHWQSFEEVKDANTSAPIGFVQSLLSECFGFNTLTKSPVKTFLERSFPINYSAESGRIPIIIAPCAAADSRKPGIDEALLQFGDDTRKRSATQLLQEYLNADEDALWGIVCDGRTLRILRDNASLTRPAWIEVNLEKIFSEGLFPDFSALWLLLHSTRFGAAQTSPSDCPLEHWKERSRLNGAAAKDNLRLGVEAALIELGRGFIQHPANTELRDQFQTGNLKRQEYYEELLRLIYRLIFLFAAEDRNLLHVPAAPETARKAYIGGYSLHRLRERSVRNASLDKNIDAWEGIKALFNALADGQSALGLVALGGLFEPQKLTNLTPLKIENKKFLKEACNQFKNKIALGLDAKNGNLSISGWKENLNIKTLDFLKEVNNFGVSRLIYTDINRDGTKSSPNFEETTKIAEISECPVIISGGVSSINDIRKAKELNNKNIEGIIVGKAIYDGDIGLEEIAKELDA